MRVLCVKCKVLNGYSGEEAKVCLLLNFCGNLNAKRKLCNNLKLNEFRETRWHVRYQQALLSLNLDFNKFKSTVVRRTLAVIKLKIEAVDSNDDWFYWVCFAFASGNATRLDVCFVIASRKTHQNNETICHRNKTAMKFMLSFSSFALLSFLSEVEIFKFSSPITRSKTNERTNERILCKFRFNFSIGIFMVKSNKFYLITHLLMSIVCL